MFHQSHNHNAWTNEENGNSIAVPIAQICMYIIFTPRIHRSGTDTRYMIMYIVRLNVRILCRKLNHDLYSPRVHVHNYVSIHRLTQRSLECPRWDQGHLPDEIASMHHCIWTVVFIDISHQAFWRRLTSKRSFCKALVPLAGGVL